MKPVETATESGASLLPRWLRVSLLICLAVSAGSGVVWCLEQQQNWIPGVLEAKKTVIAANRTGRLQEITVRTGQSVATGQLLCQIVDAQLEDRLISKRREINELEAEVSRSRAAAEVEISWRCREPQKEIFEIQLKIAELSQDRLNRQVEQFAWKERLSTTESLIIPTGAEVDNPFRTILQDLNRPDDRRLVAMLREDAAAGSVESLSTQIALCEQRLKSLESLEKELESKVRASSGVDVAEARLKGSKAELAAIDGQTKELSMVSSIHGTVGDIKFQSGDRVPAGSTVIEILNDQQSHVIAQVPSQLVSKVREGTKVTLVFPSKERRTGIVAALPTQTVSVGGQSESYLPVKIEPTGKLWPKMAIGSNVKVQLN